MYLLPQFGVDMIYYDNYKNWFGLYTGLLYYCLFVHFSWELDSLIIQTTGVEVNQLSDLEQLI